MLQGKIIRLLLDTDRPMNNDEIAAALGSKQPAIRRCMNELLAEDLVVRGDEPIRGEMATWRVKRFLRPIYVDREIIKEVEKQIEVPVEIIKEVEIIREVEVEKPVEVIREVEVIKEVERIERVPVPTPGKTVIVQGAVSGETTAEMLLRQEAFYRAYFRVKRDVLDGVKC